MQNVINLKEWRERRPRSVDYLKDGYYYQLTPCGNVFQASREGHYSRLWTLFEIAERLELDVTQDGRFCYRETIFTLRDLAELAPEEAKAIHHKFVTELSKGNFRAPLDDPGELPF